MILIRVEANTAHRIVRMEAHGHALLADPGQDVVCAAVSTLVENLANSLEILLGKQPTTRRDAGLLTIQLEEADEQTDLLFASTLLGLRSIARQHPEQVKIEQAYTG
ncbi:MAG: ribosomal-processing cysteine protease Prp [Leptospiraceae bacterium]|nr:ribosomal-processing cysteine protease Prp [Leptospiraceae bacterium]